MKETTIKIDWENNGEDFWTAAEQLDPRTWGEPWRKAVRALRDLAVGADVETDTADEITTTATEAQIVVVAETLPGWADGPPHARHPILIEETVIDALLK